MAAKTTAKAAPAAKAKAAPAAKAKAAPAAKAKAAPAAAYQDYIRQALGGLSAAGAKSSGYLNQLALAQGEQKRDAAMAGGLTTFGGPAPANPYIDKLIQAELALARDKAGVLGQGAGYASQLEGLRYKTDAQKALQEAQFAHQTSERTGAQDWKTGMQEAGFGHQAGMQQAGFGHQAEQGRLGRESQMGLAQLSAGTTRRGQDIGLQQSQMNLAAQQARDASQWQQNLMQTALRNPKIATQNPYFNQMWKGAGGRITYGMGGGAGRPQF